jgi:hypothetical protein
MPKRFKLGPFKTVIVAINLAVSSKLKRILSANFAQFGGFCPDILFLTKDNDRIQVV